MADELIPVEKDGVVIKVHPGTLANHIQLGWKVVEKPTAKGKPASDAAASKPGKKGK